MAGNLEQRMRAVRADADGRLPDGVHDVHVSYADRLAALELPAVPTPGEPAPDFELPNAAGRAVSLSELLRRGPAVVTFYRGVWCPYCSTHLRAYQEMLPALRGAGATLVAISPQTPDNSLSTAERNELEFEVLSDAGNDVARRYGLVFQVDEEARATVLQPRAVDLPRFNGDESWELPAPGTFVVGADGRVVLSFAHGDFRRRLEPSAILAVLGIDPDTAASAATSVEEEARRSLDISFDVRGVDRETGELGASLPG